MTLFLRQQYVIEGGGLKASTLEKLLTSSYTGDEVDGFQLDRQVSTDMTRVYVNQTNGQVVVAHRGTSSTKDWGNNAVYGLTGEAGYRQTARFRNAERVQKLAEEIYGAKNITTIGHSQGALLAQMLGKNTKEILTLNKASRPEDLFRFSKPKKQYDVRSDGDIVSAWQSPFQNNKNNTTIKKQSNNPLTEHSVDVLNRLNQDKIIGKKNFYVN
jgi:hypothetical protein